MGFNTLVTIKGADLDKIAQDQQFGERLRSTIQMSGYRRRGEDPVKPGSGMWMSESLGRIDTGTADYDVQVAVSQHADHKAIHAIVDGTFWTLGQAKHFPAYEVMAETLRDFGVMTTMKTQKSDFQGLDPVNPAEGPTVENARMNGYDRDTLMNGTISFTVLNDGIGEFTKDKDLGARIQARVGEWWGKMALANALLLDETAEIPNGAYVYDSISSGRHANPISIIGVTPQGCTDIVMVSGNCGNRFQATLTVEDALRLRSDPARDYVTTHRASDLVAAKTVMLQSGFHVRMPDEARAEGPAKWNKDRWVVREAADAEIAAGPGV